MKKLTQKQLKLIKAFAEEFGNTETVGTIYDGTIETTNFNCMISNDSSRKGIKVHINGYVFDLKED